MEIWRLKNMKERKLIVLKRKLLRKIFGRAIEKNDTGEWRIRRKQKKTIPETLKRIGDDQE